MCIRDRNGDILEQLATVHDPPLRTKPCKQDVQVVASWQTAQLDEQGKQDVELGPTKYPLLQSIHVTKS